MADSIDPPLFERIVVGVDGERGGRDALALAALLQRAGGGELIAVHVHAPAHTVDLSHPGRTEAALAAEQFELLERELAAAGLQAHATVMTENSPARALHTAAERHAAQLIVVGACHLTGAERVVAGDDATGTLHGAPCAVAVAPRGFARSGGELRLVGVGVDDSPEANAALELARHLARRVGAVIRATTVVHLEHPFGSFTAWEPAWPVDVPDARDTGQRLLDRLLADPGHKATGEVAVGTTWEQLASRSGDLDLLVLGARNHSPLRRLVLGSTSTKLVRHIPCPLLVLPRTADARRDRAATGAIAAREAHVARR